MNWFWVNIPLATPSGTSPEPRKTQRQARRAGRHRRPPSRRLNLRRVAGIRPASYGAL